MQTAKGQATNLGYDWDSLQWLDAWFHQERLVAEGRYPVPILRMPAVGMLKLADANSCNASHPAVRSLRVLVYAAEVATRSMQWRNATVHELRCRARAAGLRWLGKYGRRKELQAALLVLNMGSAWVYS